ncbi:hypothetical protein [Anaeroselena agilis]|uniref:Single-stranded DNA-binding protein BPT7 domain-containing protein n=1 Tax=Anaeroselena agilis TaxID=3063788 RepID=A0ABU3NUX9_9FIRM|nr:hypothetical protein [Selenomonadales bacterium 4137-cl]
MAKQWKQMVSPVGEAYWARLRREEEYKGKPTGRFSISLKLPLEATQQLLKELEAEYDVLKKTSSVFQGQKPAKGSTPNFGTKEDSNGDIVFKFSTKSTFESKKTGETFKKTIPIFSASGKALELANEIGNGSRVRVSFSVAPKFKDSKTYGLQLFLDAVKVIQLVEYKAGGLQEEAFGFEPEDGYEPDQESGFCEEDSVDETEDGGAEETDF